LYLCALWFVTWQCIEQRLWLLFDHHIDLHNMCLSYLHMYGFICALCGMLCTINDETEGYKKPVNVRDVVMVLMLIDYLDVPV